MGIEQRALNSNVNPHIENGRLSKPNVIQVLLVSVIIAVLTGCRLVDVASGFSAQKAAIGYWSCEAVAKNNDDDFQVLIVDVRDNHTLKLTASNANRPDDSGYNFDLNGTWRIFDGDLTVVVDYQGGAGTLRVPGFSKLSPDSTKFSFSASGGDGKKISPRIKVISASRFEITGSEAGSEPWRCEKA